MDISHIGIPLRQTFVLEKLCSVHYFEFSKNYVFTGEAHDFWELVYVDKGEIIATAGEREFPLSCGEILFHRPGEWHNIRANGAVAPNVMIVSFSCHGDAMERFSGLRITATAEEKTLLSEILTESRLLFASALDDPFDHTLKLADPVPMGGEQQLGNDLTGLLISLGRRQEGKPCAPLRQSSHPLLEAICAYMQAHLSEKMTLETLAGEFHVSQSYLKKLFAEYTGGGAIHYFLRLRTERAKTLLRESEENISQIAEALGYENVYYFSSQFRKMAGMSPLEYRRSVKALDERARAK